MPDFLTQRNLPPDELPLQHSPREVAVPREEIASSCLSFEAKIDQFRLEEEGEAPERPVELSNSEAEFDRFSAAHSPRLVVARIDTSSEEEEEMALNPRKGLKNLVAGRNKGLSSKEAAKTQLPPNPSLPPFPSPLGLHPDPNLQKKKRKEKEIEGGEIAPPKGLKQQKINKDRQRETSVESREAKHSTNVRYSTWNPKLELDGTTLPWNSSIKEF